MGWIKIGRTEYNQEAIKSQSLSQFKKANKQLGSNAEVIYYKITGKKPSKKKSKEE
jgi:hypothetical protein